MSLTSVEHMLIHIERKLHMVDQNVATLVADVAAVKTNVAAVAAVVAALLKKQSQAIDDEDLAAIVATHADLAAANDTLAGLAKPAA